MNCGIKLYDNIAWGGNNGYNTDVNFKSASYIDMLPNTWGNHFEDFGNFEIDTSWYCAIGAARLINAPIGNRKDVSKGQRKILFPLPDDGYIKHFKETCLIPSKSFETEMKKPIVYFEIESSTTQKVLFTSQKYESWSQEIIQSDIITHTQDIPKGNYLLHIFVGTNKETTYFVR